MTSSYIYFDINNNIIYKKNILNNINLSNIKYLDKYNSFGLNNQILKKDFTNKIIWNNYYKNGDLIDIYKSNINFTYNNISIINNINLLQNYKLLIYNNNNIKNIFSNQIIIDPKNVSYFSNNINIIGNTLISNNNNITNIKGNNINFNAEGNINIISKNILNIKSTNINNNILYTLKGYQNNIEYDLIKINNHINNIPYLQICDSNGLYGSNNQRLSIDNNYKLKWINVLDNNIKTVNNVLELSSLQNIILGTLIIVLQPLNLWIYGNDTLGNPEWHSLIFNNNLQTLTINSTSYTLYNNSNNIIETYNISDYTIPKIIELLANHYILIRFVIIDDLPPIITYTNDNNYISTTNITQSINSNGHYIWQAHINNIDNSSTIHNTNYNIIINDSTSNTIININLNIYTQLTTSYATHNGSPGEVLIKGGIYKIQSIYNNKWLSYNVDTSNIYTPIINTTSEIRSTTSLTFNVLEQNASYVIYGSYPLYNTVDSEIRTRLWLCDSFGTRYLTTLTSNSGIEYANIGNSQQPPPYNNFTYPATTTSGNTLLLGIQITDQEWGANQGQVSVDSNTYMKCKVSNHRTNANLTLSEPYQSIIYNSIEYQFKFKLTRQILTINSASYTLYNNSNNIIETVTLSQYTIPKTIEILANHYILIRFVILNDLSPTITYTNDNNYISTTNINLSPNSNGYIWEARINNIDNSSTTHNTNYSIIINDSNTSSIINLNLNIYTQLTTSFITHNGSPGEVLIEGGIYKIHSIYTGGFLSYIVDTTNIYSGSTRGGDSIPNESYGYEVTSLTFTATEQNASYVIYGSYSLSSTANKNYIGLWLCDSSGNRYLSSNNEYASFATGLVGDFHHFTYPVNTSTGSTFFLGSLQSTNTSNESTGQLSVYSNTYLRYTYSNNRTNENLNLSYPYKSIIYNSIEHQFRFKFIHQILTINSASYTLYNNSNNIIETVTLSQYNIPKTIELLPNQYILIRFVILNDLSPTITYTNNNNYISTTNVDLSPNSNGHYIWEARINNIDNSSTTHNTNYNIIMNDTNSNTIININLNIYTQLTTSFVIHNGSPGVHLLQGAVYKIQSVNTGGFLSYSNVLPYAAVITGGGFTPNDNWGFNITSLTFTASEQNASYVVYGSYPITNGSNTNYTGLWLCDSIGNRYLSTYNNNYASLATNIITDFHHFTYPLSSSSGNIFLLGSLQSTNTDKDSTGQLSVYLNTYLKYTIHNTRANATLNLSYPYKSIIYNSIEHQFKFKFIYRPPIYASMPADQDTTTPIRTGILKGTPATQLFVIESVEYPGYYLKYNSTGTTSWTTLHANWTAHPFNVQYTDKFIFTNQNVDFTDSNFQFKRDGTSTSRITSQAINEIIGGTNTSGYSDLWSLDLLHGIMLVEGTTNIFAIDVNFNRNPSINPKIFGLFVTHLDNSIIKFAITVYAEDLLWGTHIHSTNSTISNVPIQAQFKILWI